MKVLLDSCVWGNPKSVIAPVVTKLSGWEIGRSIRATNKFSRMPQPTVACLSRSTRTSESLPSSAVCRTPESFEWLDLRHATQGPACVAALARYGEELQAGALVTVEQARIRIRPADRRSG